ncbi:MAG: LA2681 family HEPN domain-containing protein, partial [Sulfurimonas sp.]
GIPVEKLRTSFRLCFGILDKIAIAICELYDVKPNGQIYFQNFWRLDEVGRRDKFESIKNPGLLALYSIATDLNLHKDGEWSHFKNWRNSLEHGLFIVLEDDYNIDPYDTFYITADIEKISIKEFTKFLEQLLQLTRSAIFSFVFSVRYFALQSDDKGGLHCELNRKNFKHEENNA